MTMFSFGLLGFIAICFSFLQIGHLLTIPSEQLEQFCIELQIDWLNDDEYRFLQLYHKILSLVARALKSIESNKEFFGFYLPTLFGLRRNLGMMKRICVNHVTVVLVETLEECFEESFGYLMDKYDDKGENIPLYLAMLTNPTFKTSCMGFQTMPRHATRFVKTILLNACLELHGREANETEEEAMIITEDQPPEIEGY